MTLKRQGSSVQGDQRRLGWSTLLDSKIMMTHYSAEVLFSDEARARFVEPNLSPIPRYDG